MNFEMQTQEARRERLRLWLSTRGGSKAVCDAAGVGKSVETRISNVLNGEAFGSRGARSLEERLSIPVGYLDGVGEAVEAPAKKALAEGYTAQAADLAELLDLVKCRIARSDAYSQCSKIIIETLRAEKAL
jgi:hypothetical protein